MKIGHHYKNIDKVAFRSTRKPQTVKKFVKLSRETIEKCLIQEHQNRLKTGTYDMYKSADRMLYDQAINKQALKDLNFKK